MGETSQGKIKTNSVASSKVETLSIIDAAQKFFRHPAARLPAACNQMNAPCNQLRNKKVRQCAWFLRLDVGQGLPMQETFPCSYYGALVTRGQVAHYKYLSRPCWQMYGKGFTVVKSFYLYCFSLLSAHVISGQWLIRLAQFRDFPLSWDHL